jgi:phage-related protein
MVSNSTAVPQINSEPIIKNISDNKQQVALIEEKLEFYIEKLSVINPNIQPKGIFDILLAIITAIINFLISVIDSFINFIQVIWQLLSTLVTKIKNLINLIIEFIEWLIGLFNPRSTEFI